MEGVMTSMAKNHLRVALNAYRLVRGTNARNKKISDDQSAANGDSSA
jgi:hypothetical protein